MDLDELDDLFDDLSLDGPTEDQLFKLYGIFLHDIAKRPLVIDGVKVKFNNNKSRHPICRGKAQTFEHIITRESKHSGKRNFDPERANKIHWIRPIIESAKDSRIKYFEKENDAGQNQLYYWYEEKCFLIIIRVINPDYLLITTFQVDREEKGKYKSWYESFRNGQKKNPTS